MIVKNEEAVLRRILTPMSKLVDKIYICDTGSVDKTKEIAREFTDEIYDFLYKISKMAYKIPKNPYKNKWPNITLLKAKKLLNIFGNILQNINTISKKYVKIWVWFIKII